MSTIQPGELSGIAGEIVIQTGKLRESITGIVTEFPGMDPSDALAAVKQDTSPYLDHFIFVGPSMTMPGISSVYIVTTEADSFNVVDGNIRKHNFSLFITNPSGTGFSTGARLSDMVDRRMDAPVGEIKVETIDGRQDRIFQEKLAELIKGKEIGFRAIAAAIIALTTKMQEIVWDIKQIDIDLIDDPKTPKGAQPKKIVRVHTKTVPPPTGITLHGLPDEIRKDAAAWLGTRMQENFYQHSLCASRKFSAVTMPGDRETERPDRCGLVPATKDNTFSWVYPPDVPQFSGHSRNIGDAVRGLVSGREPKTESRPIPNSPMPISSKTFDDFIKWLSERLKKQPGIYNLEINYTGNGPIQITVHKEPHPQIVIRPEAVAILKKHAGVDLTEEMELVNKGTINWSDEDATQFFDCLKRKFRAANRELLDEAIRLPDGSLHNPRWEDVGEGRLALRLITKPLIDPQKILIEGDTDLPGIGGKAAIRKILASGGFMTSAELAKKLLEVEELYHRSGFLIAGENPLKTDGLHIRPEVDSLTGVARINIKIARMGSIHFFGEIGAANEEVLTRALWDGQKGWPLSKDLFTIEKLQTALGRQALVLAKEPSFTTNRDGTMDVVLDIGKPDLGGEITFGGSGQGVYGGGSVTFHHPFNQFKRVEIGARLGAFYTSDYSGNSVSRRLTGNVRISVQSNPLNRNGWFLSGFASYFRSPYIYQATPNRPGESGIADQVNGGLSINIPVGRSGIASTLMISAGLNGSVTNRRGRTENSPSDDIDKTIYAIGEYIDAEITRRSVIRKGDLLIVSTGMAINHDFTNGRGDLVISGGLLYVMPIVSYKGREVLALEVESRAGKVFPLYGGDLLPEQMFGPGNVPLTDAGASMGDPYSASFFWYNGVFLLISKNRYIYPAIGGTISSRANGDMTYGGILVFRTGIGLAFYIGIDRWGRVTGGLGTSGVLEVR